MHLGAHVCALWAGMHACGCAHVHVCVNMCVSSGRWGWPPACPAVDAGSPTVSPRRLLSLCGKGVASVSPSKTETQKPSLTLRPLVTVPVPTTGARRLHRSVSSWTQQRRPLPQPMLGPWSFLPKGTCQKPPLPSVPRAGQGGAGRVGLCRGLWSTLDPLRCIKHCPDPEMDGSSSTLWGPVL